MEGLREQGVIPAHATAAEAEAIYAAYVQELLGREASYSDPSSEELLRKSETNGQPVFHHGRLTLPGNKRRDVVLTLLVEFAGTDSYQGRTYRGRLHNQVPPPSCCWDWVSDFSPEFYGRMFFDRSPGARSMANYFQEQSGQSYTLDGAVFGWVQVNHSEWYYGADRGNVPDPSYSGLDNLNLARSRRTLVKDAVKAACDVPWKSFDNEDPLDSDGDGNFDEPDGYVDHFQLVHAGTGQEQTGYPNDIYGYAYGPGYRPLDIVTCDPDVRIGPHTLLPETGPMGEFAHEFAHTLGLPDLYDTIYSGAESVQSWSMMASGFWLGCPGANRGTCPPSLDAWSKYTLGWLQPVVAKPGEVKRNVLLRTATSPGPVDKAIKINLPDYVYTVLAVNTPHRGSWEWWGGYANRLTSTLTRQVDVSGDAQLTFWTWFDIEAGWDYGYVEVSADAGATWTRLQGNITTNDNPNGTNEGNGITGSSPGWVWAAFDLSPYAGHAVLLRFRYKTDAAVLGRGWAIDDVSIDGFFDDAETGDAGWAATGFSRIDGAWKRAASHYYMVEWRTPTGFDVSMNGLDVNVDVKANPGMLVWYRNQRYNENWVRAHPWAGQLLLVDAHPELLVVDYTPDLPEVAPLDTPVQILDAPFGLAPTYHQPTYVWFTAGGSWLFFDIPSLPGVPTFNDRRTYVDTTFESRMNERWWAPFSASSVKTPTYGLKITVTQETPNAGMVNVDFRGFTP